MITRIIEIEKRVNSLEKGAVKIDKRVTDLENLMQTIIEKNNIKI